MRTKSNASKWWIGLFASFLLLGVAIVPAQAQTMSADQILQALRNNPALLQQLSALLGQTVSPAAPAISSFTRNLTVGSRGADVSALQTFLTARGFSVPATGYFGPLTRAALVRYQASVALPATGFFGPLTRANIASLAIPGTGTPGTGTGGPVTGTPGAEGQLADIDEISAEVENEVREGEEGVAVLGMEMTAEDSDIQLERLEVEFIAPTTGSDDLDDYIDAVGLTLDGEDIATLDVDEGSVDDDVWTFRFTGLNDRIDEGETAELRVTVDALENVDTEDEDNEWTVIIPENGLRAADMAGFSDTYPGSDIESNFAIASLSSSGLELRVGEGDEEINDAHTVSVDADSDTDNVDVLSFTLEAEASDITVTDIPVRLTATGAGVGEIINRVSLYQGSTRLDDASVSSSASTTLTVTFTDLDLEITDGEEETLTVRVDVNDLDGNFTSGDAIRAEITSTQTDAIDAEDENGDDVEAADLNGTATGEDVSFFEEGVNVSFVRQSATEQDREAGLSDEGRYEIVFRVTAFGDDIFVIDNTTEDNDGSYGTSSGVIYSVTNPDGNTTRATLSSTARRSGDTFEVSEGSSEEFTLTVFATAAGTGGTARVALEAIEWATTAGASQGTIQTSGIDERFQTGTLDLSVR